MTDDSTVEMYVHGLVLDAATQAPVIILKDAEEKFTLPIWIGIAEATSIASAIKKLNLSRPLTHDLLFEIVQKSGYQVEKIVITELRESTYYADLVLVRGEETVVLDARPSDAIAIAVRSGASIQVAQNVLEQAKVFLIGDQTGNTNSEDSANSESSRITDFQAIDKDKWAQILEELDPEDFKYKV